MPTPKKKEPARPAPKPTPTPYTAHHIPKSHIRRSWLGLGPVRRQWLGDVLALVREQGELIRRLRPADHRSYGEAFAASKGVAGAEATRDRGAKQLESIATTFDRTQADIAGLRDELDRTKQDTVIGARGELLTSVQAEDRLKQLVTTVADETANGSLKHRRVPASLRRLALFVTVVDAPVLTFFLSQLFNVNWTDPTGSLVPLLITLVFAVLGSVAIALGLGFFARQLRAHKGKDGELTLPPRQRAGLPLLFLVLSIAAVLGTGLIMAYRIVADGLAADTNVFAACLFGLFFAVVVVMQNVVVFAVHYEDGSTATEELDHLTRQLRPIRTKQQRLKTQIEQLNAQLVTLRQQGERRYTATISAMSESLKAADQLMLLARSYHQGCGWGAEFAEPDRERPHGLLLPFAPVDTTVLDKLINHLRSGGEPAAVPISEPTAK
ncbi:FlxA-like family protein [Nocardia abscessus]|uniref:FlxA-like family protein n=1 Tax=Nocardia abscessus TaxID=120957 RepID=UPI0024555567|nr:hypothetical protein [Nocardia abscessus]